jgi:Reverse transcriptase (RNA-dependent DNA polymerase)
VHKWTFRDIHKMLSDAQKEWKAACCKELESLCRCNVFELVDPPKDCKIIRNRWVFDLKSDGRKKARLVAKGFSQIEGIDYDEIFSPVVWFETVQMMIALAALKKWHIQGLDIKTAFLYGELNKELYMEQPEGFKVKGQEGRVMRLKHAIYGLKQVALAWWKALDKSMVQLGFTCLLSDSGIFVSKDKSIVTIVYVDDVLFLGPNKKDLLHAKEEFMKKWECRDLGEAKEFLHMRIQHKNGRIYLDQTAYLQKVLQRFKLQNTNLAHTLLPEGYQPSPNMSPADPSLCSQF